MGDETAEEASHGPVRTFAYRLTWLDALAWETLPGEWRGWRKFLFFLWLALAGVYLGMLPENLTGPEHSLRWWLAALVLLAIQYGLLTVAMNLRARARARRRIPVPCDVALEEWDDHLREIREGRELVVRPDMIAAVIPTARHVFVAAPPDEIIVPLAAFADSAAMADFAEVWEARSRAADAPPD